MKIIIKCFAIILISFLFTDKLSSQDFDDNYSISGFYGWIGIKESKLYWYDLKHIDFLPSATKKMGERNLFFCMRRLDEGSIKQLQDFQLTIGVYDSATVLILWETEGMPIRRQMDKLADLYQDSSGASLYKMVKWRSDTIVTKNDSSIEHVIDGILNKSTKIVPWKTSYIGPHYDIYCKTHKGLYYMSFGIQPDENEEEPLYVWIDRQYSIVKKYIYEHK